MPLNHLEPTKTTRWLRYDKYCLCGLLPYDLSLKCWYRTFNWYKLMFSMCIVMMTTVIRPLSVAPLHVLLVTLEVTGGYSLKWAKDTCNFTFCPKKASGFYRMCLKNDFMMYNLSSPLQLLWSFLYNKTLWYVIQLIIQRAMTCQGPLRRAQSYLVVSKCVKKRVMVYRRLIWCKTT